MTNNICILILSSFFLGILYPANSLDNQGILSSSSLVPLQSTTAASSSILVDECKSYDIDSNIPQQVAQQVRAVLAEVNYDQSVRLSTQAIVNPVINIFVNSKSQQQLQLAPPAIANSSNRKAEQLLLSLGLNTNYTLPEVLPEANSDGMRSLHTYLFAKYGFHLPKYLARAIKLDKSFQSRMGVCFDDSKGDKGKLAQKFLCSEDFLKINLLLADRDLKNHLEKYEDLMNTPITLSDDEEDVVCVSSSDIKPVPTNDPINMLTVSDVHYYFNEPTNLIENNNFPQTLLMLGHDGYQLSCANDNNMQKQNIDLQSSNSYLLCSPSIADFSFEETNPTKEVLLSNQPASISVYTNTPSFEDLSSYDFLQSQLDQGCLQMGNNLSTFLDQNPGDISLEREESSNLNPRNLIVSNQSNNKKSPRVGCHKKIKLLNQDELDALALMDLLPSGEIKPNCPISTKKILEHPILQEFISNRQKDFKRLEGDNFYKHKSMIQNIVRRVICCQSTRMRRKAIKEQKSAMCTLGFDIADQEWGSSQADDGQFNPDVLVSRP